MRDLMLDIETLGVLPGCIITEIAAISFDRRTGATYEEFHEFLNQQPQLEAGLHFTEEVVNWRLSNTPYKEFDERAKDPIEVLKSLSTFLANGAYDCIWAHASFDFPIISVAANKLLGVNNFFNYRNLRDIRTLLDLSGEKNIVRNKSHTALGDCIFQIGYVNESFKKIGVR